MQKKISEVIANQNRSSSNSSFVGALGDVANVQIMANCWASGAECFTMIGAAALIDFAQKGGFTPGEFEAFKLGLNAIPEAMMHCATDIANKKEASKEKTID